MSGSSSMGANSELMRLEEIGLCYSHRDSFFSRSDYWALHDISFSIYHGETIGIIGRNGVGKTTLLRLLSNIISPDKGRIWREDGMLTVLLSLQAGFIPSLTGRQNAVMSAITLGLSRQKIESCMDQVVDFAELHDFIDQPVAAYSSGMRARLGFSVAMHIKPDILLIDEVFSVGDEDFRKKSSMIIRDRVEANETTVLVTHNVQLAKSLCTRLIWVEEGRVRMMGKPDEVVDSYLAA